MNKRLLKLSREENKYNKRITSFGIIKGSELFGALSFRKKIFDKINLNSKFKYGEDTDLILNNFLKLKKKISSMTNKRF